MENQPDGLEEARRIFEVDAEIKRLQSIRANHVRAYELARAGVRGDAPALPVDDEAFNVELLRRHFQENGITGTSTYLAGLILDALPARNWTPKTMERRTRRTPADTVRIRSYLERLGFVETSTPAMTKSGDFQRKV